MMRYRYFLTAILTLFFTQVVSCKDRNSGLPEETMKNVGIFYLDDENKEAEFAGIFLSAEPSYLDEVAAKELQKYISEFFMTDLPLLSLPKGEKSKAGYILVGEAALEAGMITREEVEAVGESGYFIRCADGSLSIAGMSGDGTLSGIYAFLEHMGAKFLSANVSIPPGKKKLVVPTLSLSRKPFFKFRSDFAPYQAGYTHEHMIGDPRALGSKHSWVHTADFLVNYDKYHKQHPEYFALMKDGRRLTRDPNSWRFDVHVCMSNPEVRRVATENVLRWIEAQPDRKYFMVSQGDGRGDKWCQCKKCQALDAVPGKVMTDRLLDFVNHVAREVAKKYPDKILFTLSYTEATGPVPVRVKPEPNVYVLYCPYPWDWGCQSHAFCEKNRKGMKDLADWVRLCPQQLFIFDYPVGYKAPLEIFGSFYAMVDKIRYYAKSGIRGIQFCGTPRNFNSLFKYVMNKLLWDPEIDVEKTIDEFMELYYGKDAGPIMREYFNLIYREIRERPVHQMCEGDNPELVTEKFAEEGYLLFDRAMQAAGNNEEIQQRILDEKLFLLYSDLHNHNKVNGIALKNIENYAQKLAEFTRMVRQKRLTTHMRRTPMADFFWETARIRFSEEPWYSDPKVDEFLANLLAMLQS